MSDVSAIASNEHSRAVSLGGPDTVEQASSGFGALFIFALMVRLGIDGSVLGLFYNYSDAGGSVILKIHPGSYLLIYLGTIALVPVYKSTQVRASPLALGTALLMLTPPIMLAWSLVIGRNVGIGYLIDSVLIGPMSLVCLAYLTPRQRLAACNAVVGFLALNSMVVLIEFATKFHILPALKEASFRPQGFLGHPLAVGTLHVALLPALFLLPYSRWVQWALTILLSLSVIASQARFATLVCGATLVILFILCTAQDVRSGRYSPALMGFVASSVVLLLPILGYLLFSFQFFDRILLGLDYESSQARIVIYNLFDYMSDREFLFGMDVVRALYLVNKGLKLQFIESAVVVYVINFGAIGGGFIMLSILLYALGLAIGAPLHAKLAVVVMMLLVLSNNGLASKGVSLVFIGIISFGAATARKDDDDGPSVHWAKLNPAT